MEITNHNIPLYQQIIVIVKQKIVSGEYQPGHKLPSIREMALEYEVTPNTIQRALQALEQEQIIFTERTNGKYVTQNKHQLCALRNEILRSHITGMLFALRLHGFSDDEIRNEIEKELKQNE